MREHRVVRSVQSRQRGLNQISVVPPKSTFYLVQSVESESTWKENGKVAVTTPQDVHPKRDAGSGLQEIARKHLWMHFADGRLRRRARDPDHRPGRGPLRLGRPRQPLPRRSQRLFCCNAGHGRADYGEAALAQVKELDFYTNWSYAHPRSIELAERVAALTPGDLNHVFFHELRLGGRRGRDQGRARLAPLARPRSAPQDHLARSPITARRWGR